MTNAERVREFHAAFGLAIRPFPQAQVPEAMLRARLMKEEWEEYLDAVMAGDIVGVADALADLLYVTYGAALAHGIAIDRIFAEIHRSNMTKLGRDGRPIYRADGKILKGPNYEPPELAALLGCRS